MYNRSRTLTEYEPIWRSWIVEQVEYKRDAGSGFCSGTFEHRTETPVSTLYPKHYSRGTIEDFIHPKVKHHHVRRNSLSGLPMAVKPVHHTRVSIDDFKDVEYGATPLNEDKTIVQTVDTSNSLCLRATTKTQTTPPLAFMCERFGIDYVKNVLDHLPITATGVTYADVEWASLCDQFDEASKSLVTSDFFAGESIAEGAIFIDAFKAVTHPTKAITGFIKDVRKRGLHRLRLGELNRYYRKLLNKNLRWTEEEYQTARDIGLVKNALKEGIDQHLSYQFGVVPAIHDVRSTIDSHNVVEDRLRYLNKHRGQYIPIRARKRFDASFTPGVLTNSPYLDFEYILKDAFTVARLFGQGRVRTDINEASRWRAYAEYFGLNKIVGTAWELIPFSFVFDWFTNSQEAINSLTRIPLGESPFMNLTSIGHSVKNIAYFDYCLKPGYDVTYGFPEMEPNSPFPVFSFAATEYTRTPGFPDTSWFADLSNFGLFQYATGAELLFQKFL